MRRSTAPLPARSDPETWVTECTGYMGAGFAQWRAEAEQGLRSRRVRIWSAGCSSGEEPYTLAMLLAQHLPTEEGWDNHILATDISTRALERARKGIYDLAKSSDIPKDLLQKFMLRGVSDQQGGMKVKLEVQEMVEFRSLNLNNSLYAVEGPYDVILWPQRSHLLQR